MCSYNFKNKNEPEVSRTDQIHWQCIWTESYNIHKGETEQRIFHIYTVWKMKKNDKNTTAKWIFFCVLWINSIQTLSSYGQVDKYNNCRLQKSMWCHLLLQSEQLKSFKLHIMLLREASTEQETFGFISETCDITALNAIRNNSLNTKFKCVVTNWWLSFTKGYLGSPKFLSGCQCILTPSMKQTFWRKLT